MLIVCQHYHGLFLWKNRTKLSLKRPISQCFTYVRNFSKRTIFPKTLYFSLSLLGVGVGISHTTSEEIVLEGQFNEMFDPHFSSFELTWANDQRVKIISVLVKILPSYYNFSESLWGITLRRVNLSGAQSQSRSIIPWGVMWLFRILFKGTFQQGFWLQFFS